ncbi:MAG: MurR/RpiR family transcriptional regulator [Chloroflexi bacterium]|nr:MurR/RpiR family transcriptional regulator [Chloroflexota bacterium]
MRISETSDIQTQLTEHYADLTPKQKRLAQYFIDNLYVAAFESANELATRLQVSPATVVRFCQHLGYAGYPEFQAAVRAALPKTLTAAERGERALDAGSSDATMVIERVFEADINVAMRAQAAIKATDLELAAQALVDANKILVLGSGVCSAVATYLDHGLQLIALPSSLLASGGVSLAVALSHLDERSVVVGFGVWRYLKSVANAMVYARQSGARLIAITDSPVSPLSTDAEFTFVVPTDGVGHTLSMTGMMAVANALLVMISHIRPLETVLALHNVDEVYVFGDLLISN